MAISLVQIPQPLASFYAEVMRRKEHDHHASHGNGINIAYFRAGRNALRFLAIENSGPANPEIFFCVAFLLSLERICYIWVWRQPSAFGYWSARPIWARMCGRVVNAYFSNSAGNYIMSGNDLL